MVVVALDLDGQVFQALLREFRQPGVEQPNPDAAPLPVWQHVDSSELRRFRRAAHKLRKSNYCAIRFGDEKAGSRRRERATQALGRVPAVEQSALDFIRNDAGIGDPPRRPSDGLHLGEVRHLGSSDDHALAAESHDRWRARNAAMKPTIPSPVRIQCQIAHRSSRDRTVESARPPRTKDSFVSAKKMGYVTITPIAETAATSRSPRRVDGPDQQATTAATVVTIPAAPKGSISPPMRCE